MRPVALLYDWDNTLVDAWAGVANALNVAFAAFAMPSWTVEETKARVRGSFRDAFPTMFGAEWRRAGLVFQQAMTDQHLDHLKPMPGVREALAVGGAWPQAVVSNKDGGFLRREVAHLGWTPLFGAVVGAGDAAADKPAPDPVHLALTKLDMSADRRVWFIGDTITDMDAARAAGCMAVLIGDAAHEGGLSRVAHDLHFETAGALADKLGTLV